MTSQIDQWGSSLAVRIPKYIVEELGLKANDAITLSVVEGKVILEPIQTLPEFTLDELLAQVTDPPGSEIDWGELVRNEAL